MVIRNSKCRKEILKKERIERARRDEMIEWDDEMEYYNSSETTAGGVEDETNGVGELACKYSEGSK